MRKFSQRWTEFCEKTDNFITKWKMQGFGVMTFTINLHGTLTANTWRFTPRHQPYELCNPSTCYLITLEISTASSELQEGEREKSLAQLFWLRRFLGYPSVTRHKFFTFLEKHILTMLQFGKILWNFLNDTMSSGAVCLLVLRQGW